MIHTFLWSLKDRDEDFDYIVLPSPENTSLPSSLNILTPKQAVELLLLFSQNSKNSKSRDGTNFELDAAFTDSDILTNESLSETKVEDSESSSTESGGEFVDANSARADVQTVQTIEIKNISTENMSISRATEQSADIVINNNSSSTISETSGSASRLDNVESQPFVDTSIKLSTLKQGADVRQISPTQSELYDDTKNLDKNFNSSAEKLSTQISTKEPDLIKNVSNTQVECIDDKPESNQIIPPASDVEDDISQQKFDELTQLLNDARRAMTSIVSSQEKLNKIDKGKEHNANIPQIDSSSICAREAVVQHTDAPSSSSCNLDDDNRAGKYNKKPAPKAPLLINHEDSLSENESENALKATLVIKTGTLKKFSNPDTAKDVFLAHPAKKKKKFNKLRAKESFSKLLTIPKNIFQSAFHKEQNESSSKEEDSSSTISETSGSVSRSGSIGSQVFVDTCTKLLTSKQEPDVVEIPLRPEHDDDAKNIDNDINSSAEKQIAISNKTETDFEQLKNNKKDKDATNVGRLEDNEKNVENKSNLQIRQTSSQSFHSGKKEIITDI